MRKIFSRKGIIVLMVALVTALTLGLGLVGAGAAEPPMPAAGFNLPQVFLDKLAGALGIERSRLDTAWQEAGQQTIDEAVTQGKLSEEQAARLQEGFGQGKAWFMGKGLLRIKKGAGGQGGMLGLGAIPHDQIAATLGLSPEELRAALQAGQSLDDIAAEAGLSLDQMRENMAAQLKEKLDQAVAEGKLTQEQVDKMLQREKKDMSQLEAPRRFRGPQSDLRGKFPRPQLNELQNGNTSTSNWLPPAASRNTLQQL